MDETLTLPAEMRGGGGEEFTLDDAIQAINCTV